MQEPDVRARVLLGSPQRFAQAGLLFVRLRAALAFQPSSSSTVIGSSRMRLPVAWNTALPIAATPDAALAYGLASEATDLASTGPPREDLSWRRPACHVVAHLTV